MSEAIEMIVAERRRQIDREGWTHEHDDEHAHRELAEAAAVYAAWAGDEHVGDPPVGWPWDRDSYKPTPGNPIRDLVKAGALIVAEIERLQRAALGRLEQELDETKARYAEQCELTQEMRANALVLKEEAKRLERERDLAADALRGLGRERDELKRENAEVNEHALVGYPEMDVLRKVRNERDDARAELARLRPAAEAMEKLEEFLSTNGQEVTAWKRIAAEGFIAEVWTRMDSWPESGPTLAAAIMKALAKARQT